MSFRFPWPPLLLLLWGLVAPADARGQASCSITRAAAQEESLEVVPLKAPDQRVSLSKAVSLVLDVGAGAPTARASGSLAFDVAPESVPLRPRAVVRTASALESTLNPSVALASPRPPPDGTPGQVEVDAVVSLQVDLSGLRLRCGDVVIGWREDEHDDEVLPLEDAIYPRTPVLRLAPVDSPTANDPPRTLGLLADDPLELPLAVERRHPQHPWTLVRLQTALGLVIRGWVPSRELTLQPRSNVFFASQALVGRASLAQLGSIQIPTPLYRGPAEVAAGAPVVSGPDQAAWAEVARRATFDVSLRCGQSLAQIFPTDLTTRQPLLVPAQAVTLPAGADPCRGGRGAP